ncbi:MAG: hypothetical protein J5959_02555 [Butyrivibrio sp.]|nr:hypothetical protein [Butyrivibrio sp.]
MKKRFALAAVGSVLMTALLAGCAGNASESNSEESMFGQVSGSASEQEATSEQETTSEQPSENQDNSKNEEQKPQDDTASSGYDGFKAGTAKAKYTGAGDRTAYLETSLCLEKGKSYTMDEIISALEGATDYKKSSDPTYTTIDCGSDGVQELLVQTSFDPEFTLYMIIKDINGELTICFDQDGWSRSDVQVETDGTVMSSGSGGANVHVWDQAFIDADGEYHFYYGCEETLTLYDSYYLYDKADYKEMSVDGLDVDHIGIRDYYFEPDYEDRTHYYEYFMLDDNYNDITTDADYDDSNPVKARFKEYGVDTYSAAQIKDMLDSRAAEIGYSK